MADIYCQKCGEPWEVAFIYDADEMTNDDRENFLQGVGCPACRWGKKLDSSRNMLPFRAQATSELLELYEDDVDAVAMDLEDLEFLNYGLFWGAEGAEV